MLCGGEDRGSAGSEVQRLVDILPPPLTMLDRCLKVDTCLMNGWVCMGAVHELHGNPGGSRGRLTVCSTWTSPTSP